MSLSVNEILRAGVAFKIKLQLLDKVVVVLSCVVIKNHTNDIKVSL